MEPDPSVDYGDYGPCRPSPNFWHKWMFDPPEAEWRGGKYTATCKYCGWAVNITLPEFDVAEA